MGAFTKRIVNRVAWLELNLVEAPVNKITRDMRVELRDILESLCIDEEVLAAILISRKPNQFIAGADVEEFARLNTRAEALALVREGQELINRIETIGKPVVAAINGPCIGGGLEAALACTYRIATDHPKTTLQLPEVQLGIIPAAGGCQRLPRLIGLRNALDMILKARALSAEQAYKLGLVDELVHPTILDSAALDVAERLSKGWRSKRHGRGLSRVAIDRNPLGRRVLFAKARKKVLTKTMGHYPAPVAALDAVEHGLQYGIEAGLEHEAAHFTDLAVGGVSKNLVQLFFAGTALKKDYEIAGNDETVLPITNLGIVGAGFMGSAIAGVAAANAAVDVRLRDTEISRVVSGLDFARGLLRSRMRKGRISRYEHRRLDSLLSGGVDGAGFGRVDLVIEAVPEDLDVKQSVIRDLDLDIGSECIIASNTSTIPISRIAEAAKDPRRVVGMHFFSPAERMPLVEIVAHDRTAPWVVAKVASFGRALNKTVIVVKDSPGFWVNRILAPYLQEAWALMEEGVDIELLDSQMRAFGFPVGPITLLDEIGLDVVQESSMALCEVLGERIKPNEGLARMVGEGRLGRKTGQGIFRYRRGKKHLVDSEAREMLGIRACSPLPVNDITRRLVYSMLNEAARAMDDGVVRCSRDGDIGAIYGVGFPPFRGGPLRYLDHLGIANALATMEELSERYGDRFSAAPSIVHMAEQNERYYRQQSLMER